MMPFEISSSLFSANFLGNPREKLFLFSALIIAALAKKKEGSKSLEERGKSRTLDPLFFLWCQNFGISGRYDCPRGQKDPAPLFYGRGTKEEEGRKSASAISPSPPPSLRPDDDSQRRRRSSLPFLSFSIFSLPANARGSSFSRGGRRKRKREREDREDGPSSRMGTPPKKKTG